MLTAHLQAILTFDPIKHETCHQGSLTCMATVIEDVREREGQGKYAAHFSYAKQRNNIKENNFTRASSQNE